MEKIRQALQDKFNKELPEYHRRRIVFWQDEDGDYKDSIDQLGLDGVTVIKLDGTNNFYVKKLLNEDDTEGDYLVYSDFAYEDRRDDWLYDMELYSEEFRADIHSQRMSELNVQDSPGMRSVMKEYSKFFENKERMKKLVGFGRNYDSTKTLQLDILNVLCNVTSGDPKDIIIAVLCKGLSENENPCLDDISRFASIDKFWEMVGKYTGFNHEKGKDNLRLLATHLLVTTLSTTLKPEHLNGLETFIAEGYEQRCYGIIDEWMHGDYDDDLYHVCRKIEKELKLETRFAGLEVEELIESECLPCINESILRRYFSEISEQVIKADSIIAAVDKRRTKKWYKRVKHYYDGILQIARMQEYQNKYAGGFHIVEPDKIWGLYTSELYEIDTCYRKFHLAFGKALKESTVSLEDEYKIAADYMENLYKNWFLSSVLSAWATAAEDQLKDAGLIAGIDSQLDFYKNHVKPAADRSITFVIVSDALRYEVAVELSKVINQNQRGYVEVDSMLGVFPTNTPNGMAALLPGKEKIYEEIGIEVDDCKCGSTVDRDKILKATNPNSAAVQYKTFLEMKKDERQELIKGMEVVYVYHNVVDATGEKLQTETEVLDACEDAIKEISNLVQTLIGLRASCNIIITADHGFMYTYKPLPESDKLSVAGLNCDKIDRRYILSDKTVDSPFVMPVKVLINRESGSIQGCSPREAVRFKASGGEKYVHGGASLQEMVVPVINFRSVRADSKEFMKKQDKFETRKAPIVLVGSNRKITNNMFTLKFFQSEAVSDKVTAASYRIYMTDVADNTITDVKTIVADKTSSDEHEREVKTLLTLKPVEYSKTSVYTLVIEETEGDIAPEKIEYSIDITFNNDFDF